MNRDEHLAWAKQRALAYLPEAPVDAMTSMLSDLSKHPDLVKHPGCLIAFFLYGCTEPQEVRKWIEGFI
jgi:hypothetical protein